MPSVVHGISEDMDSRSIRRGNSRILICVVVHSTLPEKALQAAFLFGPAKRQPSHLKEVESPDRRVRRQSEWQERATGQRSGLKDTIGSPDGRSASEPVFGGIQG